jgi:hypothetical protein
MDFGLFEVFLETLLEGRVVGSLGHLGEGFDELRFGAVEVFQLIDVNVV